MFIVFPVNVVLELSHIFSHNFMTSLILFLLLSTVIFSILLYVFVFLESGIMTTFRYPRVRSAGNVITSHLNFF